MKKLFILFVLFAVVFAEKVTTAKWVNVRNDHSPKGEIVGKLPPLLEVDLIFKYGPYKKIEVLTGDHTGKIGYMWVKLINDGPEGNYVGKLGGCLREKPTKKSKIIAKVGKLKEIKVIETVATWYFINYNDIKGWIYKAGIK